MSNSMTGAEIRRRREHLGVSRTVVAGVARCSLSSVQNIETGAMPRRSRVVRRVTAALESLEELDGRGRLDEFLDAFSAGGRS